jgi:hypothetical protein
VRWSASPSDVAPAFPAAGASLKVERSPSSPCRPCRGGMYAGVVAERHDPSRLPRLSQCGRRIATPSATSLTPVGGAEMHRRGRVEHSQ